VSGPADHGAGFWQGGRRRAAEALRAEVAARIAALEHERDRALGAERRRELDREIAARRRELAARLRELRWGLFWRA
jgi:hypothetical protein